MGDVSTIIIEELDGDQRKIELVGPSLPFRGASWKSKQNVNTTWYPGNGAQGTQQVSGPQEEPSSWEGFWRRTQMSRTPAYVTESGNRTAIVKPTTIRDLLDDVFYGGSRLRVTWINVTEQSFSDAERGPQSVFASDTIVREGRATDWEFPHDGQHDIAWKVTFEWYSRGKVMQKVSASRDKDVQTFIQLTRQQIAAFIASQTTHPALTIDKKGLKIPSRFTLGQLEALANYPNRVAAELARNVTKIDATLEQVSGLVNTTKNLPFSVTNRLLAAARNTMAVAHHAYDAMTGTPIELWSTKTQLRDIAKSTSYYGGVVGASTELARAAAQMGQGLGSPGARITMASASKQSTSRPSGILAVHHVKQGETLLTLSKKYYNSPDHILEIAKANSLPWFVVNLDTGSFIVIPVLGSVQGV